MVIIITLLTQVRKEKNGKINFWTVNPPILAPPLMGRCSGRPLKGF